MKTFKYRHFLRCIASQPGAFWFSEKPKERRIHKDFIARYSPAIETIKAIKDGADYELRDGSKLPHAEITIAPYPTRSYAYCTDTAYNENIVPIIKNVSVLYHEATFMQNRLEDANKTFHSTSVQAAQIASLANAGTLLLGHYSSRYKNLKPLLQEAQAVLIKHLLLMMVCYGNQMIISLG